VSSFKRDRGEAAAAMYWRRLDCQSVGQLHESVGYLSLNVRAMRSV
jgi:hypothetical protein